MNTITNNLLRAATVVFAIATTTTGAIAQTTAPAVGATGTAAASTAAGKAATNSGAAQNAVAGSAVVASKAQQPVGLTRAEVQAQVIEARKNGTLIESEADMDVAQTRKHLAH